MPANYISIATPSGRLFQSTNSTSGKILILTNLLKLDTDGIIGVIDLTDRKKTL